jgi:acyl carrier protein
MDRNIDSGSLMDVLLKTIKEIVGELHPSWPKTRQVLPLSRDLGMDSLALVELLARIEKSFGITLPEKIFTEVETPRDLLEVFINADPTLVSAAAKIKAVEIDEVYDLPHDAQTLVDVLN